MNPPSAPPGEAEKPVFVHFDAGICAHSRSGQAGCSKCIDVCSVTAISAAGDGVKVDEQLCLGCGACAMVCPSGAMTYAYPPAQELGGQIRAVLKADGAGAILLIHDAAGAGIIRELARDLSGRVMPLQVHHVASAGLDNWLSALAQGASQVLMLTTAADAPRYRAALAAQFCIGNAVFDGLGYTGTGLVLLQAADAPALEQRLRSLPQGVHVAKAASYNVMPDKRATLEFAVEHLARHAPAPKQVMALPAAAPFGAIVVDRDLCTLCMSCIGVCPAAALEDRAEPPQLRFIERNCVQCGLCSATCPENAIAPWRHGSISPPRRGRR